MSERRRGALMAAGLLLFAGAVSFMGLGRLPLLDPDEARFSAASRDMIARGDFVIPWFNGQMRLKKPPLFYWLQAGSFGALGESEFAARLPSALGGLLLAAIVMAFAWRLSGRRTGLRAGAIVATIPLVFACAHLAIIDMTLALLVTATLVLYFLVDRGEIDARHGALSIGLCQGLGWLAKGPVATLAPLAVIALYHLARREPRRLLPRGAALAHTGIAAAVTAAIGLPWLLLAFRRVGMDTFLQVALRETVERADSGLEHPQPWFFYILVLPLVSFPWAVWFLPAFVSQGMTLLRRPRPEEGTPAGAAAESAVALDAFLWCWVAGMVVFFSCIAGKLTTYILPALPAVALLTARAWERWSGAEPSDPRLARRARLEWGVAAGLLAPLVGLAFLVAWWDREHARAFLNHSGPFVVLGVVLAGGVLALSARPRRRFVVPLVAGATAAFYAAVLSTGAVELAEIKSLRALTKKLRLAERPEVALAVYRDDFPSLAFYARRPFTRADDKDQLQAVLLRPGPAIVIMDGDRWNSLAPRWQEMFRPVGEQDRQRAYEKSEAATPEAVAALR